MIDMKGQIDTIVGKIQKDPAIAEQFKKEPIKAVEKILGVDLPDELIQKLVDGVKDKLSGKKGADQKGVSGMMDSIKKMF